MVRRISRGAGALSGAVYSALVPITALILLSPSQYGVFSVPYLIFSFGLSLQLSTITEAWNRRRVGDFVESTWGDFWSALLALSLTVGVGTGTVVALVLGPSSPWWLAGLAVAFALARNGARYFDVAKSRGHVVTFADVSGIAAFAVALLVLLPATGPFFSVLSGWLAASAASILWTGARLAQFGGGPLSWVRNHGRHIRPLLADSLLLDAGSIGTPFILAPFLGATKFGIYRGISNVALPVRLILEPLRPSIGGQRVESVFAPRTVAFVLGLSAFLAMGCYLALEFIVPLVHLETSTLGALTAFSVPASVFVVANFVGHYYYIVCRSRGSQLQIIVGRLAQTGGAVFIPVLGYVTLDLIGAIWGFVAASGLSAACWAFIALRATRTSSNRAIPPATEPVSL
jgi:hypothetical protein